MPTKRIKKCTICGQPLGTIPEYSKDRTKYGVLAGRNHIECQRKQSEARARIIKAKEAEAWARAGQMGFDLGCIGCDAITETGHRGQ